MRQLRLGLSALVIQSLTILGPYIYTIITSAYITGGIKYLYHVSLNPKFLIFFVKIGRFTITLKFLM